MRLAFLSLVVVLTAGCSNDATLSGVWTGVSTGGAGLSLTLVENSDGVVTGAGRLVVGLSSLPVNAVGAHVHPSVSLTIDAARLNFAPVNFQGVFDRGFTTIRGALNNASTLFNSDSLVLSRASVAAVARITAP